ncbi:MAG: MiaB/RimO family radical SAM methylthiotransferase [Anaerolineales bacterium]|nr:MiaB/RimO family radical SAM methylthiotransferase [Anaerolineales bacterium]
MKVYLDSVGCRLNQSEIEAFARQFRAAGHSLAPSPDGADLVVVNTCTVTTAAASDSRQKLRQASKAGARQVVVTGCWSTLEPEGAANFPGVTRVVPNAGKDSLVADLLQLPVEAFDHEPVAREPLPGARLRTRAFIKAQDGCDNRCTFCITTLARGRGRSRPPNEVLADIRYACGATSNGSSAPRRAQEIVLTGVHLGSWGDDLNPPQRLSDLVRAILAASDFPRLRLSSLEPWDLDEDFFSLWEDERLCRQLHLPLQSGNAATLRRMARKTTPEAYARLVEAARRAIPQVAITTDIIAGFPGETEAEFTESLAFVHQMRFAGGHVFTYSARPGTAAARLPSQVPHAERRERNARLRAALAKSAQAYQEAFLGATLPVLWETATALGPEGWRLSGLTDNYLRVQAATQAPLWNQLMPVRLARLEQGAFWGELSDEQPTA